MRHLASKVLRFCSRVDKVAAFCHTIAHKLDHNSGLQRAKRKVERSGPDPIVVLLEQTVNMTR